MNVHISWGLVNVKEGGYYCRGCVPKGMSQIDLHPVEGEWDCYAPACDVCGTVFEDVNILHKIKEDGKCEYCLARGEEEV